MLSFFSNYLLNLRKKSGLSQNKFADVLDVSTNTICSIENGNSAFPNKKLLESIASYNKENSIKTIRDIVFDCEGKNIKKHDFITLYSAWYTKYGNIIYYYVFDNKDICNSIVAYQKKNPTHFVLYVEMDKMFTKYKNIDESAFYSELTNIYKYYIANVPGLITHDIHKYVNKKTDIKTAHFVLDSNNKKHIELFNRLKKQKQVSLIKLNVYINLFDANQFKLIDAIEI